MAAQRQEALNKETQNIGLNKTLSNIIKDGLWRIVWTMYPARI